MNDYFITINLLPHREAVKKEKTTQFFILLAMASALAAVIVFMAYTLFSSKIDTQKERNDFLKTENGKLEKQIDEIKSLREEIKTMLARKEVVENLQLNRNDGVNILDELVRLTPEGIHFKALKQVGEKITINGFSQASTRISILMRNIESSSIFQKPELVEVRAIEDPNIAKNVTNKDSYKTNEFTLNFYMERAPVVDDDKPKKVKK